MTVKVHVLLVTDDVALRAAVTRARPRDGRLHCLTVAAWNHGQRLACEQLWVDMAGEAPDARDVPGVKIVAFTGPRQTALPEGWTALRVPKPPRGALLAALWASVLGLQPTAPQLIATLPAWVAEFMELDLATLRRRMVEQLPLRLGFGAAVLFLRDGQGAWTPSDAAPTPLEDFARHAVAVAPLVERAARGQTPTPGTAAEGWFVPLLAEGAVGGVLNLVQPDCGDRSELALRDLALFQFLGRALRNARTHAQTRREARHDALTGLGNVRGLQERLSAELSRAERFQTAFAALAVDLDGLKQINDFYGHAAGDAVLEEVAARIGTTLRQFDYAARSGGDEFLILLPTTDVVGARQVALRLLDALHAAPLNYRGQQIPLRASVGIAQHERGASGLRLVQAADAALYAAKSGGGDQMVVTHTGASVAFRDPQEMTTLLPPPRWEERSSAAPAAAAPRVAPIP